MPWFDPSRLDLLAQEISKFSARIGPGLPAATWHLGPTNDWRVGSFLDGDACVALWFLRLNPTYASIFGIDPSEADLYCHLDRIAVLSTHRRLGIGTCLYSTFETWLREGGCRGVVANGVGQGALFVARMGFDFAERALPPLLASELRDATRPRRTRLFRWTSRRESLSIRYPFEVLDARIPEGASERLLTDNTSTYMKMFDAWDESLNAVFATARHEAGCH